MKYIEILGSELLVLLLLLLRHCLSQWVLIFRRGHGLEVKSVELTEFSATPVGVTGRFPREFRDVEMKRCDCRNDSSYDWVFSKERIIPWKGSLGKVS